MNRSLKSSIRFRSRLNTFFLVSIQSQIRKNVHFFNRNRYNKSVETRSELQWMLLNYITLGHTISDTLNSGKWQIFFKLMFKEYQWHVKLFYLMFMGFKYNFVFYLKIMKQTLLNRITLGQTISDPTKRLITNSEWASTYFRYERVIWEL